MARAIHRQGPAAHPAVRGRQPRRHPRHPARIGAVRPREGRLHGRARAQGGQVRAGPRRHPLPRRGRQLRIDLQAKLLRALQEREIERLGGVRIHPVDVRVIAATNVDLRAGRARADLPRGPLLPPQRGAHHASRRCARARPTSRSSSSTSSGSTRGSSRRTSAASRGGPCPALQAYDWPGNVRELENIVERSVALATGPVVRLDDLPVDLAIHEVNQRAGGDGGTRAPSAPGRA